MRKKLHFQTSFRCNLWIIYPLTHALRLLRINDINIELLVVNTEEAHHLVLFLPCYQGRWGSRSQSQLTTHEGRVDRVKSHHINYVCKAKFHKNTFGLRGSGNLYNSTQKQSLNGNRNQTTVIRLSILAS